jgi:hypothetical protein
VSSQGLRVTMTDAWPGEFSAGISTAALNEPSFSTATSPRSTGSPRQDGKSPAMPGQFRTALPLVDLPELPVR